MTEKFDKPSRGRPSGTRAASTAAGIVRLRCRLVDKAAWVRQARAAGQSLSAWIIDRLNRE